MLQNYKANFRGLGGSIERRALTLCKSVKCKEYVQAIHNPLWSGGGGRRGGPKDPQLSKLLNALNWVFKSS